ncbi:TraB/TrbI/VirB10 family type IV secretion system protein [Wolbachia endosymbiont of Howardula sp.]|uniref:TrbI/VirB10 family protein n=1 Tax=Wolbachia endosymbiont of Howardula sp. TaxID=2916816 RepID=UPI00217DD9A2|nr:TrbI/VirB10 family protein [Wolbachia endosymbiont of Howardula sp.]UWI82964.1 type VI secretion protein [Wolbachia endosymbiont of Howardula sp.]
MQYTTRTNISISPKTSLPITSTKNHASSLLYSNNKSISVYPKSRRNANMLVVSSINDKHILDHVESYSSTPINDVITRSKVNQLPKLNYMIIQGKIIDAVLETAIDSDLNGMLRAIVSRDVYSETGNEILIPKGSKLIGSYSCVLNTDRPLININWNRIILPQGIDITISSPSTDLLGRVGISGVVENKLSKLSSMILASIATGSILAEKIFHFQMMSTSSDITKNNPVIDTGTLKTMILNTISSDDSAKNHLQNLEERKWQLSCEAIKNISHSNNDQDRIRIFKKEIASLLDIQENVLNSINIEQINQLINQSQKNQQTLDKDIINTSMSNILKNFRNSFKNSTEKRSTIYLSHGTALKVLINQDIIFNTIY